MAEYDLYLKPEKCVFKQRTITYLGLVIGEGEIHMNLLKVEAVRTWCYAQALGVVDVGSLLVELSWRIRVHSGRPSCRASQGQNHGVRRGCRGSGEVRQST